VNKKLELYAYTTKTYLKEGLIKVGHTMIGRSEIRVQEQFGTSNPEGPIFHLIGELSEGMEDKVVHDQLVANGCQKPENSPGKEWFYATLDDVRLAYNEVVNGASRLLNFRLREEQEEAVEKAKKWFLEDYSLKTLTSVTYPHRFLINAKMRFGKCFTSIHLAKAIGAKKTLIITYKPDVIDEWMETVNQQVAFADWTGIRAKRKKGHSNEPTLREHGEFPDANGPIVLCVSLQDLKVDKDGNTKKRLEGIVREAWDLVIFDEVHYGSMTDRVAHILQHITFPKRLDLSGTPFRLIEQDDFSSLQIFTYSYLDEQSKKKKEILEDPESEGEFIYRQLPDLDISTIQITEEDIAEQVENFETDDIDFSLNTLFETRDGRFVYEDAVDHFIEGLCKCGHDARSVSVYGKLAQKLGLPSKRHSVWWMQRVDSVNAFISKLSKHPYFSNFILINASGSDAKENDDERLIAREKGKVQKAIEKANRDSSFYGTITFTCGRFLTGVTIKEWESILILNDGKSAESYFQAIFRVQSTWAECVNEQVNIIKPKAWVFDFAISRCLKVVYDCALSISDQVDQRQVLASEVQKEEDILENVTTGLCQSFDIKRFLEGSLTSTETTSRDIFEATNHFGAKLLLARRITSNVLVNFGSLKLLDENPGLFEILKKVKGYRTQDVESFEVGELVQIGVDSEVLADVKNDPDIPPKEKEKILGDHVEKEKDKDRRKRKRWYATQIKRLAICMADFIYMTYEREFCIDDVIFTKSPEFFEVMTGISKDDFKKLCDFGFINKKALNKIVREFKDQEDSSVSPEQYILNSLLKMAS